MKYAIFGDIHGNELKELEQALRFENPDTLICTGDFDQVRSIRSYMELEQDYRNQGKQVITVPGNHDHSILNNLPIYSGTIAKQGKDCYKLHEELKEDKKAHDYLDNLVNSRIPGYTNNKFRINLDKNLENYRSIIIHGAYDGDLMSNPYCEENEKDLWTRLLNPINHKSNFNKMDQKGYQVMIRGHDHNPEYTYNDEKKGIVSYSPSEGFFRLFPQRQHTITHGALFDGYFATLDTDLEKQPILKFHQL